jgi:hypothetical protein
MKRVFVFGVTVVLLLSVAGCAGTPTVPGSSGSMRKGLSGVPTFVNDAYLNASEDVLVGIGTYRIGNDMSKMGPGKTFAETRARADIARQLSAIVNDMVSDYMSTSEIDQDSAVSFQENITRTLSRAELKGARTVKMERDDNGLLWVVMEFSKSAAETEVNQASSAAKLAIPTVVAFDALERMDAAFAKEAGGGPIPMGD